MAVKEEPWKNAEWEQDYGTEADFKGLAQEEDLEKNKYKGKRHLADHGQ